MKYYTLECPNNLGNVYEEHPSATRPKELNGVWKYACNLHNIYSSLISHINLSKRMLQYIT